MIAVIGGNGNMGSRYMSILRYLGEKACSIDVDTLASTKRGILSTCKGVIVATPTKTHFKIVMDLYNLGVPVLVEKPFSLNLDEVYQVAELYKGKNLMMVNQYKEFIEHYDAGPTYYNYFKHGNDGIYWDCISIIALAKTTIDLRETSPIWQCTINGFDLDISLMDKAYIQMIRKWLKVPHQPDYDLIHVHKKVVELARNH